MAASWFCVKDEGALNGFLEMPEGRRSWELGDKVVENYLLISKPHGAFGGDIETAGRGAV